MQFQIHEIESTKSKLTLGMQIGEDRLKSRRACYFLVSSLDFESVEPETQTTQSSSQTPFLVELAP